MEDEVKGGQELVFDPLDQRLRLTATALLVLLALLLLGAMVLLWVRYSIAIHVALGQTVPDHAAAISYARALDAGTEKVTALLLAFTVVFLGALYVLRSRETAFTLRVGGKEASGDLETASPGLVMVALGMVLVGVVVLTKSDLTYTAPATAAALSAPGSSSAKPAAATVTPKVSWWPGLSPLKDTSASPGSPCSEALGDAHSQVVDIQNGKDDRHLSDYNYKTNPTK